jgi:hypothetical protein
MNEKEKLIPRKIWLLWYQGVSEAPFIVRKCIDSWIRENPTWDVIVLDSDNLNKYVNIDLPENIADNLSLAHKSDLDRLALLSKHGGIWADATTFCTKPLDGWIDDYSESGFFVFYKPGKDRIISNWFIASKKDCQIIIKLYDRLRFYWIKNNFDKPTKMKRMIILALSIILNRNKRTTKYWFSPIVTRLLGIYPYYVFHYMFERLVSIDDESKYTWRNTKKISADLPHSIQSLGQFSFPTESIKRTVNDIETPLYKLNWRYDHNRYSSDTLLYYLIEERKRVT